MIRAIQRFEKNMDQMNIDPTGISKHDLTPMTIMIAQAVLKPWHYNKIDNRKNL